MRHERLIAVFVVVAVILFVGYQEFSNSISGAGTTPNEGYRDCYDSDPANDVTVRGEVTATRVNKNNNKDAEPIEKIDACIGPSRVREWACSGTNRPIAVERNTYCAPGSSCISGACV